MTGSLPPEVQAVFDRFITTEYTTIDRKGQPITWPVTPYYSPGDRCIDLTTGLGYPKKADDAAANPKVALLFSDPHGSGLERPPMVLVQGTADVDDRDLDANRARYSRESGEKLPATKALLPPERIQGYLGWYFTRIYVHVRPERIYVWRDGDASSEPELFDTHMEEVRSGHVEEPEAPHAGPEGTRPAWDPKLNELGTKYPTGVISFVCSDGFPFATRVPIRADAASGSVRLLGDIVGAPLEPGLGCITVHEHNEDFTWQRNFQVRGDLLEDVDGWALRVHRVVGGFEVPPSRVGMLRENFRKAQRFRRIAKRELAKRTGGS